MNTINLKEQLKMEGFITGSNDNYYAKELPNDWIINVEWLGEAEYPRVVATHRSQLKPTKNNPYKVELGNVDHNWVNRKGIVTTNNYVRNKESATFKNQLVPMAIELLQYRLQ